MKTMNKLAILASVLLSAACAPAAKLADSSVELPERYPAASGTDTTTVADVSWTEFFPDTLLQRHIRTALEGNFSFLNCMNRIRLAENELKTARLGYWPSVSAGLSAGLERFGEYTMDGVGNSTTNTPDLDKSRHIPDPYPDFGIGVSFSWEIDLWGKVTQKKRAALSRWMASIEAASLARSVLISEIARTYFSLVDLDMKRQITEAAIDFISRSCELTEDLKDAGEITQLAVDQFQSRLIELKGILLENENETASLERAMCILTGRLPEHTERRNFYELRDMEYLSDTGVPDMLLTRRPDIKEAEMMLAAADCDIKAARKAFYPGLRLGGAGGFNAFDIGRLFLAPASLAYEIAAGLTAPVFNAGKIRNEYSDALVRRDMAVNNYKETVVKAYSEVCGLIESSENIRERIDVKKEELKIGKKATASANELFRMQFIGYLEVLAADRDYFECCESYIDLEIERMKLQADLYRALGGGGFPAEGTATAQ